jgi:hypothetical protein
MGVASPRGREVVEVRWGVVVGVGLEDLVVLG